MRQTLRLEAARIRCGPLLRVALATAAALSFFSLCSRADESAASRREAARAQFERAEKTREALETKPESGRTLKEYTALVVQYQRVSLTTPQGAEVPAAMNEVAQIFRTMGDLFDAKYYQR